MALCTQTLTLHNSSPFAAAAAAAATVPMKITLYQLNEFVVTNSQTYRNKITHERVWSCYLPGRSRSNLDREIGSWI